MDVNVLLKIHLQQKQVNIFHHIFQCLQYCNKSIENKHHVYRGKDCMKKFCDSLREHAIEIMRFKKKKMKLLTNMQQESYETAKICYVCPEKCEDEYAKDKQYCKIKIVIKVVIIQVNMELQQTAYEIYSLVYLRKYQQFFTVDLTMITILSSKSQQTIFMDNLLVQGEILKNT